MTLRITASQRAAGLTSMLRAGRSPAAPGVVAAAGSPGYGLRQRLQKRAICVAARPAAASLAGEPPGRWRPQRHGAYRTMRWVVTGPLLLVLLRPIGTNDWTKELVNL